MPTMRKMHTQKEVEQIMAPEIAKLYAAIAGKIAFDMQVEIGNGPYAIPANTFNNTEGSANIPCLAKLVQTSTKKTLGFALVTASGANYEIIYLFQGNIYKANGVAYDAAFTLGSATDALLQVDDNPTEDSTKLVKSGGVYSFVKPIYCHPVRLQKTSGDNKFLLTCLIFNNDATPFTLTTFKQFLDNLLSVVTIPTIMASGYYKNQTDEITSASYIYCYVSQGDTLYGVQGGLAGQSYYASVGGTWADIFGNADLFDNVNRIN